MKTNIRKAKISDLEAIKEIEDESFINPFTKEDLLYEISQNPVSNFLVLEKDGLVVGFIDYWVTFDSATIDQIAVKKSEKKSERNQGFAKILLEKSINDLKELGEVSFFTLEVRASNEPAINLYKSFGFQKVTIKEKYYDDGEDAIYMIKGLV